MKLVLIGYRGTGKSTVARLLAARLDWPWVDADVELEARAGMTIREIFAAEGEPSFRDREANVLADMMRRDPLVLATGGGVILREENRAQLRDAGVVVWLTASPRTILARVHQDRTTAVRRPNLTTRGGAAEIRCLLRRRRPLYNRSADLRVATDHRSPNQVANEILRRAGLR